MTSVALAQARVQRSELGSRICRPELPVDLRSEPVALLLPCRHFALRLLQGRDPSAQALPRQHVEFDLRGVKPASLLRRVVDVEPFPDAVRLLWRERLVERRGRVCVQVVHDERYPLGVRVHHVHEILDLARPVACRAASQCAHVMPSAKGLHDGIPFSPCHRQVSSCVGRWRVMYHCSAQMSTCQTTSTRPVPLGVRGGLGARVHQRRIAGHLEPGLRHPRQTDDDQVRPEEGQVAAVPFGSEAICPCPTQNPNLESLEGHPYLGFSGRLALIHLEFPVIVGVSSCSGTRRKRLRPAAHGTRTRPQTPPLREWTRACLSRGGNGGARRGAESFSGRRGRRRAGSPRGADAEAKARGFVHLAEATSVYPPSRQASFAKQNGYSGVPEKAWSELLPRAAATNNGPVCHCPVRKSGIRWTRGAIDFNCDF